MQELSLIQTIAVWALPVLFAITLHEVAHGWVAKLLGDPTAQMLGRLTINPIKHIDPVGTVVLPLLFIALKTGFMFGWAKPVPVTWQNLKNPKRDMALVAVAGPSANLLMAIFWAVVLKITSHFEGSMVIPLIYMCQAGIAFNIMLMVLNLLPLPPLDGGRILSGLLPDRWSFYVDKIEPYGFIILLVLLFTGVLSAILLPLFYSVLGIFSWFISS